MPFIELKTNIKIGDDKKKELVKILGKEIQLLNKTEDWLMINIIDNQNMYFKGSSQPCMIGEVKVYGDINPSSASKFTAALTTVLNENTGINADRIYFSYWSTKNWGYSGFNF